MIVAKVVRPQRDANNEALNAEEIGDFQFVALPRAGDRINFESQHTRQFATVDRVVHFPFKVGLTRDDYEHPLRDGPEVAVLIL